MGYRAEYLIEQCFAERQGRSVIFNRSLIVLGDLRGPIEFKLSMAGTWLMMQVMLASMPPFEQLIPQYVSLRWSQNVPLPLDDRTFVIRSIWMRAPVVIRQTSLHLVSPATSPRLVFEQSRNRRSDGDRSCPDEHLPQQAVWRLLSTDFG